MDPQELINQLQELRQIVAQQQNEINNLHAERKEDHSSHPTLTYVPSQPKELKVAPPEYFFGNRKKSRNFLLQLQNVFHAQPALFATDANRIAYAVSYLRDSAFEWISPHLESSSAVVATYQAFADAFYAAFSDVDRQRTAERKILSLRQRDRSVSTLVSEFQRLAIEAKIDPNALFPIFYQSLNDDVKDELCRVDRPGTMEEYYRLAIRIDDRLLERKSEKRHPGRIFSNNQFSKSPAPKPSDAMILDNVQKRGPISQEEKDRRRTLGLCLYCSSNEHQLSACPLRPQNSGNGPARN